MQLSFILNNCGHFFYIIGQSTYSPLAKTHRLHEKFLPIEHYTYIGIYFVIVAVLAVVGETLEVRALRTGQTSASRLMAIAIAVTSCTLFAPILQCKSYPVSLKNIHELFLQVDYTFRKNLRRTISYQSYLLSYRMKFIVCILVYIVNVILVITLNVINDKELLITSLLLVLESLSVLINLHAVFYIGLHALVQEHFCKIIDSASGANDACSERGMDMLFGNSPNCRQIKTNIQIYKIVHFKLWKASQAISEYFGWGIMFWCLQNSLIMTNAAFYLYIFLQRGHFAAGILRTYRFFTIIFNIGEFSSIAHH